MLPPPAQLAESSLSTSPSFSRKEGWAVARESLANKHFSTVPAEASAWAEESFSLYKLRFSSSTASPFSMRATDHLAADVDDASSRHLPTVNEGDLSARSRRVYDPLGPSAGERPSPNPERGRRPSMTSGARLASFKKIDEAPLDRYGGRLLDDRGRGDGTEREQSPIGQRAGSASLA